MLGFQPGQDASAAGVPGRPVHRSTYARHGVDVVPYAMTENLTGRTIIAAEAEQIAPDVALLVIVLDDGTVLGGLRVVDPLRASGTPAPRVSP
jgi:hypothetical protein